MDALAIPEILDLVCSYLDVADVRRFRLCCRAFAHVAARYVFREIVFYLHHDDLDILRRLSMDPVISKNIHSIAYICATLDTRRMSRDDFQSEYNHKRNLEKVCARYSNERPPPRLSNAQLDAFYRRYQLVMDHQDRILAEGIDFSILGEVMLRLTSLRNATVSSDFRFHPSQVRSRRRKTPFDSCLVAPSWYLDPEACRHVDALLSAVCQSNIQLEQLTIGQLSWRFFQKPPVELSRALSPCANLKTLQMFIDTGLDDSGPEPVWGTEVPECREMVESGLVRDFIASLARLEDIYVVFSDCSDLHGFPARLENILRPGHRWAHLTSLTLGTISCERQELMAVFKRHRETLRHLCLRDIELRSTSWLVLLRKVRKTLDLEKACVCGNIYGITEDTMSEYYGEEEYWDLRYPEEEPNALRKDVNDWLIQEYDDLGSRPPLLLERH
ncbi:hypothetical protein F5Y15DRAFT_160099 [Xylariaceae sp. FL0016]|nr:hypothetical protein F5Y15DRAFT_160099 [Xylariaceae sp. FL0016]